SQGVALVAVLRAAIIFRARKSGCQYVGCSCGIEGIRPVFKRGNDKRFRIDHVLGGLPRLSETIDGFLRIGFLDRLIELLPRTSDSSGIALSYFDESFCGNDREFGDTSIRLDQRIDHAPQDGANGSRWVP